MAAETDPVMFKVRDLFTESGKSLQQLGEEMGYDKEVARKSAWQFLNGTNDPRLSMLRRFAEAMGVPIKDLF